MIKLVNGSGKYEYTVPLRDDDLYGEDALFAGGGYYDKPPPIEFQVPGSRFGVVFVSVIFSQKVLCRSNNLHVELVLQLFIFCRNLAQKDSVTNICFRYKNRFCFCATIVLCICFFISCSGNKDGSIRIDSSETVNNEEFSYDNVLYHVEKAESLGIEDNERIPDDASKDSVFLNRTDYFFYKGKISYLLTTTDNDEKSL